MELNAGKELDELIASSVLADESTGQIPHYSTDENAAKDLIKRIGFGALTDNVNGTSPFTCTILLKNGKTVEAKANTRPLAICRAVLMAASV